MHVRPLVASALKVLPAVVIVVAALFEARASREIVRARPAPDAVTMLARAEGHPTRDLRRGRALEGARTLSKRELDARDLAARAVR